MVLRVAKPKKRWIISAVDSHNRPAVIALAEEPRAIARIDPQIYEEISDYPEDPNAIKALSLEQSESYLKYLFQVLGEARNDDALERVTENLSDMVEKIKKQYIHHGGTLFDD